MLPEPKLVLLVRGSLHVEGRGLVALKSKEAVQARHVAPSSAHTHTESHTRRELLTLLRREGARTEMLLLELFEGAAPQASGRGDLQRRT